MDRVWADYWDGNEGGLFDTARSRTAEEGLLPTRAKAGPGHTDAVAQRRRRYRRRAAARIHRRCALEAAG